MRKRTMRGIVTMAMVCLLSMVFLFGCTSGGGAAASNTNAAANTNAPAATNAAPAQKQAQAIDLTATNADVEAAFSTEGKDYACYVKAVCRLEVKTSSSGKNSYVIHLFVNGTDFKESIYCDCSAVAELPETGTMVTAEGTWKHMEGSSNDSAFLFYVSSMTAA